MFALLTSEGMTPFYENIASFPTVFFTFFLGLSLLYWLVAMLGWVDLDILDFDIPDADLNLNSDSGFSTPDIFTGVMMKMGLNGVPVTIIISIIAVIGWLICYYAAHFLLAWVPSGLLRYLAGLPVLLGSLYVAALITAQIIKPLRTFFKEQTQSARHLVGQVAVVRTSRVDSGFGEATVEDGGAGLLLKVRSAGDETFTKDDRVVIIDYLAEQGVYRVVSEQEFLGV